MVTGGSKYLLLYYFDTKTKTKITDDYFLIAIGRQIPPSVIQGILLLSTITAVSQVSSVVSRIQTESESNGTNVKGN